MHVGDYPLEATITIPFTTRQFSTGAPFTLASGAVEIYEDSGVTQITSAETLTADFDSVTGFNMLSVAATAANGFEAGKSYTCVLSAGTVDSVSVVGEVIGHFTIERNPNVGPLSDIESSLVVIRSDLVVLDQDASDIKSDLVVLGSDVAEVYSDTTILVPAVSDVESALVVILSDIAQVYSDTTVIASDLVVIGSDLLQVYSDTTVIASDVVVLQAAVSDVESSLVIAKSDLVVIESDVAQFNFTVAGVVDANVVRVNEIEISGDGQSGTEFGPV